MNSNRKTAFLVGLFFIIGTVAGVLSMTITSPLMKAASFPQNLYANETSWIVGTLLTLVMGLPLSMIPVLLYPIFSKDNKVLALGAVVFRGVFEGVCYLGTATILLLMLTVSRVNQLSGDAGSTTLQMFSLVLSGANEWITQILAIVFSIGSFLISFQFYRMRLIPRWLSGWGVIGSVLYFTAPFISMLGSQHFAFSLGTPIGFLIGPLAIQEMVFAFWVVFKGFNSSEQTK